MPVEVHPRTDPRCSFGSDWPRPNRDNVQWQLDIVASQWKLASLDDDAVRRLTDIIATLRALHERKQLPAEVAHWLPLAIEQAAKLR